MRALVLTTDPLLVTTFGEISKELGIESQATDDQQKVSEQLNSAKYEALVLDLDTVAGAMSVATVRRNGPNSNAVVFAVASDSRRRDQALQQRAHFLLQRPIQRSEIRQVLNAAYDLILVEGRRYFRYGADLPVRLTPHNSGRALQCTTMNISSDGMAVKTPVPLALAQTLDAALTLPDGFIVRGFGIVIWDDKHGKCGLKMRCSGAEMRQRLNSWLDTEFVRIAS